MVVTGAQRNGTARPVAPPSPLPAPTTPAPRTPGPMAAPRRGRRRALHRAVRVAADVVAWSIALVGATLLRYEGEVPGESWEGLAGIIPLAIVLQVTLGLALGLYLGRSRFGSFDEVASLTQVVAFVTGVLFLVNRFVFDRLVPASVPLAAGLGALVLCAGIRYAVRLLRERKQRPGGAGVRRLIVFGAGDGAAQAVTAMLRDPRSAYLPVALLDDDPAKRRLRITGVPVVGTRVDVGVAAARFDADTLLIAVPSASAELVRELSAIAADTGLEVRVLPPVSELFGGRVGLGDIRPLTETDLLGRHQVEIDLPSIAGYLTGRRVLVTGAGGSIGSELCRQLSRFSPESLVLLDRDESALHAVQLSMRGQAPLDTPDLVVADIRDGDRVREVFEEHCPDVVFHAAALKHVPILELQPREAAKTNIAGTHHVLDAAVATGVDRFVTVSTDKASDPTNVLGHTKFIAECLTAGVAARTGRPFLSVRFGNVLGSRGSVLDTFRFQIEAGGPVTVTDPEVTRFFMTVEEAVALTIQAGALGAPGETLVLDMGEPVRIDELAHRLVENAKRPIAVEYTGLRPGEKVHEVRLGAEEAEDRRSHPLIGHIKVPRLAHELVRGIVAITDDDELRRRLVAVCAAPAAVRSAS